MKWSRYCKKGLSIAPIVLVIGLSACGQQKKDAAAPEPAKVQVVTLRHVDIPVSVELPGRTTAYLMAQIRARVDGVVLKQNFRNGTDVTANQLLYRIDPAPYQAALENAKAVLNKAQANLVAATAQAERYKVLVDGNAISKQAYDNAVAAQLQAQADVQAGKAAVGTAAINLAYTNVVSPIAGRSDLSQVTQGAYVQGSAATLLTTVQQIDPIYVDIEQPSTTSLALRRYAAEGKVNVDGKQAAKVTLTLEDGTRYPVAGTVESANASVNPTTGSVTMRAVFPNPDHILLPGMFVRARVEQGTDSKGLLVPIAGVSHNAQGDATALVVNAASQIEQRTVETRNMWHGSWVVTAGLKEGDRVVVAGGQKVQPNMKVAVSEMQGPASGTAPQTAEAKASGHQAGVPQVAEISASQTK
jgi:membrane fusion protein (multidrug efflux system)